MTVQEWMNKIIRRDNVDIYDINVKRYDYRTTFTAFCTLRGNPARGYSADGSTPEDALEQLDKVLEHLKFCPNCGYEFKEDGQPDNPKN